VIPVLSRAQIRAFDAHAIASWRVPGIVLMENAGRGAAERIAALSASRAERVVIVCGAGNNGGDGFVVARHLRARGLSPKVFLCGSPERVKGDARTSLEALVGIGASVDAIADAADVVRLRDAIGAAGLVVDAVFGTGLDRPVTGLFAETIDAINEATAGGPPCFALDVPSGLDADTGVALGRAVRAARTFTFAFPKPGLLTPHGRALAGAIETIGIGVPSVVSPEVAAGSAPVSWIERRDVARWLTPRAADAHKYAAGHVAVLAGSPGKIGAALMVAHGALRAGAGAATIVTWEDAARAIESRVVEVMCAPIAPDDPAGSIDRALAPSRAAVIGPGFGLGDDARAAVEHVLATFPGPVVVDADAITVLARDRAVPRARSDGAPRILTPHAGELARWLGITSRDVEADRYARVREAAVRADAIVVLKGAHSLIADPAGRVVVNAEGSAALATAGSGDVLAGIVGALACALEPFDAACAGAFLHAAGGERWAARHGDRGLLATEIADELPAILGELIGTSLPQGHTGCPV